MSASPPYTLTNENWGPCFLSARPSPTNNLVYGLVGVGAFLNAIHDQNICGGHLPVVELGDTGVEGDAVAGDGLFQNASIHAYSSAVIGPRVLRFQAEALGGDGMYHVTAADVAPFFVLGQAPSGPAPAIISITPSNAAPGTQITITGSGFDPIATNNVVLIGNQPAQIISVNPQGTQLIVVVPPGLPPGPILVTVSSLGQTGAPGGFTVPGAATCWLEIKLVPVTVVAAGLDVYGTAGKSYRIEYVTDPHNNSNNWVPLTTLVLPASPYRWIDPGSINQPKRFYRSVELP